MGRVCLFCFLLCLALTAGASSDDILVSNESPQGSFVSSSFSSMSGAGQQRNVGGDGVVRGNCFFTDESGSRVEIAYAEKEGQILRLNVLEGKVAEPLKALELCRARNVQMTRQTLDQQRLLSQQIAQQQQLMQQDLALQQELLRNELAKQQENMFKTHEALFNLPFFRDFPFGG